MASWLGKSGVAIVCDQLTAGGKAVLQKAIRRAGWQIEQFSVCRWDDIPANTRALVACGDRALDELTGWKGGKRASAYTRGYLLPSYTGLPVVPTFDPSKVAMGQMKLLGLVMNDLGVALQAASGARKICADPKAVVNYRVGLQALKDLYAEAAANPELLVAFDLETATSWEEDEDESIEFSRDIEDEGQPENLDEELPGDGGKSRSSSNRDGLNLERAQIRTIQFSLRPGTGISCDWSDECRDWVQRIMQLPNPLAGHNCFYRGTKVLMADGEWKDINRIHKGEYVRTVDETGLLCNRQVTDTSHTKDARKWVEVKVDGGYKRGSGRWGNPGVVCTEDHKWILATGQKVEASDLAPGDNVLIPWQGNSHIIFGSLLGDGSASSTQAGRFTCGHVNKDWADAKASSFGVVAKPFEVKAGYNPGTIMYTFAAQIGHFWRDWFYQEDKTRRWHPPSVEALAIWYGDDGCLAKKQNATFSLHKYPEQIGQIKSWFEMCYGPCSIHNEAVLYLHKETSDKFFAEIAPLLHPSMEYKLLAKYRGQYNGWMARVEPQVGIVKSVTPAGKGNKWDKHKYCLTVDETHTFFTRMGLVSNSWLFDEPILRNHGIEIKEGTHDTLWMWHHLQPDLPAHLQGVASLYEMPFPWKHLSGADLDFYGAADVDAVQRIMSGLPKALARLGLQDGYEQYVRRFRPVLAAMERRGIPVSKSKLEDLRTWLSQEITRMDSELQPMIPSEWKGRKYWKTWPADCKPLVENVKTVLKTRAIAECESSGRKVTKKATTFVVKPSDFDYGLRENVTQTLGYGWEGDQLYKELDFNPRSSQQILAYIKAKGYPVPLRFKDKEETTSDKELERLEAKTKDPVLTLVRGIRAYSKMGNAYAGKLLEDGSIEGGWQPGPDGRLRATITFGPATGQLSSRNPNIMTTPKRRAELANKFRQCIVAEPGYKLVELDYTAFHARTLGLAAQDAAYMKLAAMDIHSFVAGHMIRYPGIETALTLSDADLKHLLEEIKSKHKNVRNFKAKPAILGIGFKMGKRRLYYENRDSYESEAEAGKLISLLQALFPNVFKWQDDICEKADKDGRLINSWGACRWFWDVMKWTMRDGRWIRSTGRDAEKATAYLPSSNAHFMLRDKLLQANDKGWLECYGLINVIHDAVLFHCPDKLVDECIHNIKQLLEAPVLQMADPKVAPNGFTCGAEAMVGPDWSKMEDVK